MKKYFIIVSLAVFLVSCTHPVHVGFDKYLKEHPTDIGKSQTSVGYSIAPETKSKVVYFRSAMAGVANKWQINVGPMIKDYMDTTGPEIFKSVKEDSSKGQPLHLDLEVVDYTFEDMRANIKMHIKATKSGKTVVDKTYEAQGRKQTGKMFWGGAAAIRHSVHQSTHLALNDIMQAFLADLK